MGDVYLDYFGEEDISFLYKAMGSQDQYLFSTRLPIKEPGEFSAWLHRRLQTDFHDFRMVRTFQGDSKETVGFVHDYDFNLKDGSTKITSFVDGEHRSAGIGAIAGTLFLGFLFDRYPLRVVYSTVYAYNKRSLSTARAAGFTEEGCLRDYRYHDNKWFDLHVFSLTRGSFNAKLRGLYEQWS